MDEKYILDRDYKASIRLNHQHYEFTNVTGHLLHPSIPISNERSFRIADIATGTGIWAADVARQLAPNATIDGFDVSAAQFPPPAFLPQNVKLHGGFDIFQPPPQELCGLYDIVYMRLVILVVMTDPTPVIRNLMRLLKPGGYLQWSEIDIMGCEIRGPPEAPKEALNEVLDVLSGPAATREESVGWLRHFADYFARCGLTDCQQYQYKDGPPPPFNAFITLSRVLTAEEATKKKVKSNADIEDLALRCQKAVAEIHQGSFLHWPLVTAVGRLPPS